MPVPPALGFCPDPDVTGAPFYVMGFVDGHVVRDRAIAEAALSVDARANASRSIVDTMAAIHAVDLDAAGLADLARHDGYIERQLKRWYGQWNQQKTRDLALVDEVHDALVSLVPEQGPATIVHGDYRLDNTIVSPSGEVVAVLDWEICTLGDPLADVGLLQVYWTGPDDEPSAWGGAVDDGAGVLGPRASSSTATPRSPAATSPASTSTSPSGSGSWPASWRACTPATSAAPSAPATGPSWRRSPPRSTPPRRRPPST